MSSTDIAKDENRRNAELEKTTDQNNAQQSTSSGIGAQFHVKLTIATEDSKKHTVRSSSLSSLDELSASLKDRYNKEDIKRSFVININSAYSTKEPNNTLSSLKKSGNSKSLNDLPERLKQLKHNEASFPAIEAPHTSISMAIASGSVRSANNSINSIENMLLREREKLEDEESFVTVDPCQKEKMTSTDVPTIFSMNDRTQNVIAQRSNYMNRPPPPYESYQRPQRYEYQGMAGQTPVYQTQNVEYGGGIIEDVSQAPSYRSGDFNMGNIFNSKRIRNKFIQKVYTILAVQLLFSFGFITFSIYEKTVKEFLKRQWPLMIASAVALVFVMIMLFCYTTLRRNFPLNFILLALLTLCMTYMTAAISCFYETKIVMISMGATGGICTLLSLLACQHWFDITGCGMILCMASLIVMVYGIVAIVITIITGSNILYLIYAGLITLLFCAYLMYDTQQILGGRRIELSPEEYILGALTLYVDIMVIFQYILMIAGHCR